MSQPPASELRAVTVALSPPRCVALDAAADRPLPIPMTALVGCCDRTVRIDAMRAWSEVCDAEFTPRAVAAGHFGLRSGAAAEIADAVAAALAVRQGA